MEIRSKIWKYDPKEMKELLSKHPRVDICEQLGCSITTLNNYIKSHQLQGIKAKTDKPKEVKPKPRRVSIDNSVHNEIQNPLELFKEEFEKRKKKRMLQELKNPYF
jgi:hypothetical protein